MKIYSIVSGKVVCLEDVSDPVFSEKMAGDGVGIIPDSSIICSPVDGTLTTVAESGHAFGFQTEDGIELLVGDALGGVAHPVLLVDALAEGFLKIGYELKHSLFGLGGKEA